jgi:hypothetical protein
MSHKLNFSSRVTIDDEVNELTHDVNATVKDNSIVFYTKESDVEIYNEIE